MKGQSKLFLLLLVLLLTASLTIEAKPQINVAYNPMPFNLPSIIEKEQGYLAKMGFQVNYHTFLAGHTMTEAMAAGKLDLAPVMGGTSAIVSRAGGRKIKIIGCYSQAPAAFALAVLPGGLNLNQLRGAKIAVPIGTEAHVLLAKILQEEQLSLNDVELVNLFIPDGISALQSGQVDGAMVVEPVLTRLKEAGQIKILRDGTGLIKGLTFSVVPEHLANSEKSNAFRQALLASAAFLNKEEEKALALAAERLDLPWDTVVKINGKYTFASQITAEIIQEVTETIDFLFKEGIIR